MKKISALGTIFLTTLLVSFFSLSAVAQDTSIIRQGDAVVTGHSGISLLKPPAGAKLEDYAIINRDGATLQIFDMSQMYGPDDARLVGAQRLFSVTAGQIGQVFGVTLDDGRDGRGKTPVPSIYATATSVFGLQIVKTENGVRNRTTKGDPNASWMAGQFGDALGGSPGSIWKIDGRTGEVSLFANVGLNGQPNSGPGLGNITFDPAGRKLYVSDLQTGMIHSFDLGGAPVAVFDHGATARPKFGLPPAAYNPATRVEITNPAFDALEPATWGYADKARSVWGLAVNGGRLYYSVADGPEIWSVAITKDGTFANDARVEIQVIAPSNDPISDVTFGRDGKMYLAQRGQGASSYDYTVLAKPQTAAVLRYGKQKLPSGRVIWQPAPDEYAVGFEAQYRNANGGVALGFGYDQFGQIRHDQCENTLWSTGELLRQNARLQNQLTPGGALIVHGLQGNSLKLVKPANVGPFKSYFIDFDSNHSDPSYRGHMGDVEIWSACAGGPAKPKPPVGPFIKISKSCSAAIFGGDMHCRITLTSVGTQAPSGPVGFTDGANVLNGPPSAAKIPLILSAAPDDPAWQCTPLPLQTLSCSIDGAILKPGQSRSVDVVVDVSEVVDSFDWRVRNCAVIDGTKRRSCVTRGDEDALIVSKSGPTPHPCVPGGPCDFEVTVFNPGKRTFDGELTFGDNLTINGAPAGGIVVDAVWPAQGCAIGGLALPLQWTCHTTIPPGGEKTFNIWLTLPAGAAPPGGAQGRNCFVASNPNLMPPGNAAPPGFWAGVLDPANNAFSPGKDCIDFDIAPGNAVVRNPGLPHGAKLSLAVKPTPSVFTQAGQTITYKYRVQNKGTVPLTSFTLTDDKATGIKCPPSNSGPSGGPLAPGAAVTCTGTYQTQGGDVGNDIKSNAKVTGKAAAGPGPKDATTKALVKFKKPQGPAKPGAPVLSLTVNPQPNTFSAAGAIIRYTYTVKNTGKEPVATFALTDNKVTGIKCLPANVGPNGGPLAPGASATCGGTYRTTGGDVGQGIVNTASVTGKSAKGQSSAPATTTGTVIYLKDKVVAPPGGGGGGQPPSLTVSVTPAPTSYSSVGDTIAYTYTVTNNGKDPLLGFSVVDNKATGIVCSPSHGPLAPGATATCRGTYVAGAHDVGNDITNFVSIYGLTSRGKVPPVETGSVVIFVQKPSMTLAVSPRYLSYSGAGQELVYTYTVNNTGSVPLTRVALQDSRVKNINCGPYTGPLQPGFQLICVGSTVSQPGDVGRDIATSVTATGTPQSGGAPAPVSANALVKYFQQQITGTPKLDIKVSPEITNFSGPGQSISFKYVVRNVGTMPVRAFTLTDPRVRGMQCQPVPLGGPLAVNQATACQASYVTTPADVAAGTSGWNVVVHGNAAVAMAPLGAGTWLTYKPKPNCPPGDANCLTAAAMCGTMEPKYMVKAPNTAQGWQLSDLFESHLNKGLKLYKPWYTGCRDNNAFAAKFPPVKSTIPLRADLEAKVFAGRACDIFCSKNHAPRKCKPQNAALSTTVVDEVPGPGAKVPSNILWICPWKITDGVNGGVPSGPVPLAVPTQASSFCWKPGGSGPCPQGFTQCGLGCQKGGSTDCAVKIVGQVFAAIQTIPLIGDVVGKVWKGAKWLGNKLVSGIKSLFGGGSTVTRAVSNVSKVDAIKALLTQRKAYQSAKAAWEKTEKARNGWKVYKGVDRSSSLINTTAGANIPRITNPGFGTQSTTEQKIWQSAHDAAGLMSIIPGPLGTVAGVIDAYGHPECRY